MSGPKLIFELFEKLRGSGVFTWAEVEQFCQAFFVKNKSNAAIASICKPAVQRWQTRYKSSIDAFKQAVIAGFFLAVGKHVATLIVIRRL